MSDPAPSPAPDEEPREPRGPQQRTALVAAIGWSLLLLGLGSLPGAVLAAGPRVWDKLAHALAYGALGALAALALRRRLRGLLLVLAAAGWATAVGALDEWHQQWVPRRSPDLLDLAADAVGAVIAAGAVALYPVLTRWRRADTL